MKAKKRSKSGSLVFLRWRTRSDSNVRPPDLIKCSSPLIRMPSVGSDSLVKRLECMLKLVKFVTSDHYRSKFN